ncbi:MAG: endonuclease/exonuclease/phosphatase family protein [Rikenellaceae bacterium]|nr:endonuclease/exonuclease/phosphatase family protein [Rikenellaceae bacterium]
MYPKLVFIILITLFFTGTVYSGKITVGFYNVENLFDTIKEPGKLDGDFTPSERYKWDSGKYFMKLNNIAQVISDMGADILGLAEVENHTVLEDLIECEMLRDYDYVHFPSDDRRGIGVALLYNVRTVSLMEAVPLEYKGKNRNQRNILYVKCRAAGEEVDILVCHIPSVGTNNKYRSNAVNSLKYYADSILIADNASRLVIMGDMNANPSDKLMSIFYSEKFPDELRYYNPYTDLYKYGYGTYKYRGRWNIYDQILLNRKLKECLPQTGAHIFIRDHLVIPSGRYKGYPFRFEPSIDGQYGYSDHLPVYITLDL